MTTPLLFAEDASIDEVSAESYNIETAAMINAMSDIEEEEEFINADLALVLE